MALGNSLVPMVTDDPTHTPYTVFAIAGYAGAGKDTMADHLADHMPEGIRYTKMKMADALKGALNVATASLGLDVNFFTEDRAVKEKMRPVLVEFGRYCRSVEKGIFAHKVCEMVQSLHGFADVVFIPDMRYINEHRILQTLCESRGWRYQAIYVETVGVKAANGEEDDSIAELLTMTEPGEIDFVTFDYDDMEGFDEYASEVTHSLYQ